MQPPANDPHEVISYTTGGHSQYKYFMIPARGPQNIVLLLNLDGQAQRTQGYFLDISVTAGPDSLCQSMLVDATGLTTSKHGLD